jgi:hypothetical protein
VEKRGTRPDLGRVPRDLDTVEADTPHRLPTPPTATPVLDPDVLRVLIAARVAIQANRDLITCSDSIDPNLAVAIQDPGAVVVPDRHAPTVIRAHPDLAPPLIDILHHPVNTIPIDPVAIATFIRAIAIPAGDAFPFQDSHALTTPSGCDRCQY